MTEAPMGLLVQRLRGIARLADTREDDGALLEAFIRRHDQTAFAALVRRHGPMVLGVCRRVLGGHDGAEDAFQAVFLVLARRASTVDPSGLPGWLHGVARNAAMSARRAAARRRRHEQAVAEVPDRPGHEPDAWADVREIIDEEIAALPDTQRQAVILCDLEGVTRREAASRLGIGDGTLSHRLSAAREALARRLSSRGVALSATALASLLATHAQAAPLPAALASAATSGLVSELALSIYSTLVKTMTTKYALLAAALIGVASLAVGLTAATARPPVPEKKADAEPAASAADLFKAHVEGRLWGVSSADADKKTIDLSEQGGGFLQIVQFNPAGGVVVQLPAGDLTGLPLDPKAVVTVDGKPAKLADLKKGMTATLVAAPGKALIARVSAHTAPAAEKYTLTALDLKKRTATLKSTTRGVTLKDIPLARAAVAEGYKAPAGINGGGFGGGAAGGGVIAIGPGAKIAAALEEVKPGSEVTLGFGMEGGKYVITKIMFEKK